MTCPTISAVVRLRAYPPFPVAQKLHRMGQPTWLETHTVSRVPSREGIPTVSITWPSARRRSSFWVPSAESAAECSAARPTVRPLAESSALQLAGMPLISSMVEAPFVMESKTWVPL